ncbi:hypothetical protein [Kordiimonas marina]|uniref:hypothetical protein n=1 Tax=Kordiimonas marina TaxID=2872312 RepID=UPI001FF40DD2|nr:hypothetical protein [Kordiimonas marina]MCJ9428551.1 hypothetical protein [Kordiimonas marina]
MALADLQDLVNDLIRDEGTEISVTQRDRAIELARFQYSRNRPRRLTETLTADANGKLPFPVAWEDGFSEFTYAALGDIDPVLSVIETQAGQSIKTERSLNEGDNVEVVYTALHMADGVTYTISTVDQQAVASWAAAALLGQLATKHAGDEDSTIQTDAVNQQTQSQRYSSRSKALQAQYYELLGIKPGKPKPAFAVADMDLKTSRGRSRIWHSGKYR